MEYNGIVIDAIMATPSCGKSYLCDKYPDRFSDMDEIRLKIKYIIPYDVTREELERTKGERKYKKRLDGEALDKKCFEAFDEERTKGKVLIAAPHSQAYEYFLSRGIKFCLVYPGKEMREEIKQRMINRGNPERTVKENDDLFEVFYKSNSTEKRSSFNYELKKGEYLEEVLKQFGYKF